MSTDSDDAHIKARIAALAALYDAFVHAIDPYSKVRDEAERMFNQDIAEWHDSLDDPKPTLQEFRKATIIRCRAHLRANQSKTDIHDVFRPRDDQESK
jgi:hypothetical protein